MATPKSSVRIGEADRAAAQRALQEHLNAGRLQVEEYADRSARAANAVNSSEIAALFTDLPSPHPKLPGSPSGGTRGLVIFGAVALVVIVGLVAFAIGRSASPSSSTVAPTPAPTSVPSVTPTTDVAVTSAESSTTPSNVTVTVNPTGISGPLPDGVTVRRSTNATAITLRPGYCVDLDDTTSPNWNVGSGCYDDYDVGLDTDVSHLHLRGDYAVETGSPQYATCSHETAYTNGAIERGSLHPGEPICVRTSGSRYALVTIVAVSDQAVQFQAIVWDPQFS